MGLGKAPGAPAYAGVDTHKDTNTLALLDALGRPLGTAESPAGAEGYAALAEALGGPGVEVGIEGCCSFGEGLAAHLRASGVAVYEVERPARRPRRGGKSDPIDARAAAENLAAGRCAEPKSLEGAAGDARWLLVAREQLVRRATALSNCVDSMLVTAPQGVRDRYAPLAGAARMRALAASEGGGACALALRALAAEWAASEARAAELEAGLEALLLESHPALMGARGVGTVTAARLVVAAGANPGRTGGEAAFSMLCGTSPIPASSGRTERHRLNRGGDRQANRAVHEIAIARLACDPRTRAYVDRRVSEGKTRREAVRCVCRYIAREVYRLITGPQEPLPDGRELAARRKALGATQAEVAAVLGVGAPKVSRAERRAEFDASVLRPYAELLDRLSPEAENGH